MLTMIGLVFCLLLGVVGFLALGFAIASGVMEYVENRKRAARIEAKREEINRLRKLYWENRDD